MVEGKLGKRLWLEPKPGFGQEQVPQRCLNSGVLVSCLAGQVLAPDVGNLHSQGLPSAYSLLSSSSGRTEIKQGVFGDNLRCSVDNSGPRPCEWCSEPLQSECVCRTATVPVVSQTRV